MAKRSENASKQGFALVATLSLLLVITTLFLAAGALTMRNIQSQADLGRLTLSGAEEAAILRLATQSFGATDADLQQPLELEGQAGAVLVQLSDVGGLVDLNTAAPLLLERLLAGYDLAEADRTTALSAFRTWRRAGNRLARVSDFFRVTDLDPLVVQGFEQFTTVYSGRPGIAPDKAPHALLALLTKETGSQDYLTSRFERALTSAPSNLVFAVQADRRIIGTIRIRPQQAPEVLGK